MSSLISCPANQLASSLLSSLWKGKGCPAWRQNFSTCRNREQAKLIHRLCFIMRSVRNTYFTVKFRPLNSRGEESSQPLLYPSLLPLRIAFLLATLEKFCSAGRLCTYQIGDCQRQMWRHQRDHQERCLLTDGCTSQYALPDSAFCSQMWAGNKEFKEWTPEK